MFNNVFARVRLCGYMPFNNFLAPKSKETIVGIKRYDNFDYMEIRVIGI